MSMKVVFCSEFPVLFNHENLSGKTNITFGVYLFITSADGASVFSQTGRMFLFVLRCDNRGNENVTLDTNPTSLCHVYRVAVHFSRLFSECHPCA